MKLSPGQARVLLYLLENANAKGECYRYVQEIADATVLSRGVVTTATSHLINLELITREQLWKLPEDEEVTETRPSFLPASEAKWRNSILAGEVKYCPAGNLYKVSQAALSDGSLCKPTQLELPFPKASPYELTILAPRARFYDRKIGAVGVIAE